MRGQLYALRLAARERRRRLAEPQIAQARHRSSTFSFATSRGISVKNAIASRTVSCKYFVNVQPLYRTSRMLDL